MKLPCELVLDLLPLYHDGVCSCTSAENVKEHLSGCESCRKMLNALDGETEWEQKAAAAPLASVSSLWKRGLNHALMKGIAITAAVFGLLILGFLALTQWKWLTIDPVQMDVAEIYQLEDGRILYKLEVPEGVWSRHFEFTHCEDGTTYLTPKRSLIETAQQQGWESLLDQYLMIDVAEQNAWAASNGGVPETRYCIGTPDDPHALLVWEQGMVLEPAPAVLETLYG